MRTNGRVDLGDAELPRIELRTEDEPVAGASSYQAIPELVEFTCLAPFPSGVRTLGLGRVAIMLDAETGGLVGMRCFVKTGRWKTGEAPPQPDAEGAMLILYPGGDEEMVFIPCEPRFSWHEESRSLRISFQDDTALVFKVADSLLAGVDRKGRLTAIWVLDLDLDASIR